MGAGGQALVVAFCVSLALWNWEVDLVISAKRMGERDRKLRETEEVEGNLR